VCYPGRCEQVYEPASAAGDASGTFVLTANLPQDWSSLLLGVDAAGYEPTRIYINPPLVNAAELRLLPTLSIRPGESLAMRVFVGSYVCGFESHLCRRVVLESPTAEPMDLEVTPADTGQGVGLFAGPEANHPILVTTYQRRVTVSEREVWVYAAATRPTGKYSGVLAVFDQPLTLVAHGE
jgi:hypothetical protein